MATPHLHRLIDLALDEDLAHGDITSEAVVPEQHHSTGVVTAREALTVAGLDVAVLVCARADPSVTCRLHAANGQRLRPGKRVLTIAGPTRSLLAIERTLLNFLQRLSGVATMTSRFADAVRGTGVAVVDTRKTTPGWRALEKAAVRAGGGRNHRSSLGEHVLIKDNHIAAVGSVRAAVQRAKATAPHLARVQIEVETPGQARMAVAAGADALLLDNMTPAAVTETVRLVGGRAIIEVSGGVTIETVRAYAQPGVDVISVGALTHSAPAVDLSLALRSRRS